MTYIPDLADVSYTGLNGPIRAVGWLETPHPINRGPVRTEFIQRLTALVEAHVPSLFHMGYYSCTLCEAEGNPGPDRRSSQSVLLVPAANCVYESPIWIGHYVLEHSYCPPAEYCHAVTSCPEPGSKEFRRALAAHLPQLAPLAEDPDWGCFAPLINGMPLDPEAEIKETPYKISVESIVGARGKSHLILRVGPGEKDIIEPFDLPHDTFRYLWAHIATWWRRLTVRWSGPCPG